MSINQTTNNRGFYMEFESGFSISVQFGSRNYCSRRNMDEKDSLSEMRIGNKHLVKATSAEIMVGNLGTGRTIVHSDNNDDAVIGWVGVDEIGKIIGMLTNAKSSKSVKIMLGKILK